MESTALLAKPVPEEEKLTTTMLDSSLFDINERVEVGVMSELFLGVIGQKIFYAVMIVCLLHFNIAQIYLFGDLAIYAVTVPLSLAKVTGGWNFPHAQVSEDNVYYIYLAFFSVFIVPWTFFNFQKTKYLQLITLGVRNVALTTYLIFTTLTLLA